MSVLCCVRFRAFCSYEQLKAPPTSLCVTWSYETTENKNRTQKLSALSFLTVELCVFEFHGSQKKQKQEQEHFLFLLQDSVCFLVSGVVSYFTRSTVTCDNDISLLSLHYVCLWRVLLYLKMPGAVCYMAHICSGLPQVMIS